VVIGSHLSSAVDLAVEEKERRWMERGGCFCWCKAPAVLRLCFFFNRMKTTVDIFGKHLPKKPEFFLIMDYWSRFSN